MLQNFFESVTGSPAITVPAGFSRPVKDQLGTPRMVIAITVVQRALGDFGAEESFGQAAKRFEEHYGWAASFD